MPESFAWLLEVGYNEDDGFPPTKDAVHAEGSLLAKT